MADLQGPFEILELGSGESRSFRVERWEVGSSMIHPPHLPEGKVLRTIRVHVPKEDKPTFPFYWDLLAKTLVVQIEPHLQRPDLRELRFTITAQGPPPPKRRFMLTVERVAPS